MNWLSLLWSADGRALLKLARRISASLDTPEERKAAALYVVEVFRDGKATPIEWAKLGKLLGVFESD